MSETDEGFGSSNGSQKSNGWLVPNNSLVTKFARQSGSGKLGEYPTGERKRWSVIVHVGITF